MVVSLELKSRLIFVALLFGLWLSVTHGQTKGEVERFVQRWNVATTDSSITHTPFVAPFSPDRVLSNVISFYQVFISSQDVPLCIFEPSCSRYGQQALRTHGFVKGILLTSDRFQRCNGFGQKHYHINPKTGKFIDVP